MGACNWTNLLNCKDATVREEARAILELPAAQYFKVAKYADERHKQLTDCTPNERRWRILAELRTLLRVIESYSKA